MTKKIREVLEMQNELVAWKNHAQENEQDFIDLQQKYEDFNAAKGIEIQQLQKKHLEELTKGCSHESNNDMSAI